MELRPVDSTISTFNCSFVSCFIIIGNDGQHYLIPLSIIHPLMGSPLSIFNEKIVYITPVGKTST